MMGECFIVKVNLKFNLNRHTDSIMFTSNRTIKWIENLADQEIQINAGHKSSIDILTAKDEVLNVETATFVRDLHSHFDYLVQLFNARVSHPNLQLKLQRGVDNMDGFTVSRNG